MHYLSLTSKQLEITKLCDRLGELKKNRTPSEEQRLEIVALEMQIAAHKIKAGMR